MIWDEFIYQPADKYPSLFSKTSLFGRYVKLCLLHVWMLINLVLHVVMCDYRFHRFPYLLPCLCISLLATAASVTCYWLPVCYVIGNFSSFTETTFFYYGFFFFFFFWLSETILIHRMRIFYLLYLNFNTMFLKVITNCQFAFV